MLPIVCIFRIKLFVWHILELISKALDRDKESGPAGTEHVGGALPNCQCLGRQKLSGARSLKFITFNVAMASAGKICCLHVIWVRRNTQHAYTFPCTMPLRL